MADRIIDERIPSVSLQGDIGDQIYYALGHDRYKAKIQEMIIAHTGTVEFEELVMKYASKEYDNRILKSARFWTVTILSAVVTSVVSAIIAILITN